MEYSRSTAVIHGVFKRAGYILVGLLLLTVVLVDSANAQGSPRAILTCSIQAPEIIADNGNVSYNPMPFPVTVIVRNTGSVRSDSAFATIILPPDLSFADATESSIKHVQYPQLFPQQSGSVQWMVKHPPTTVEKRYVIKVWVRAANADSSLCEAEVIIPPLAWSILSPRDYMPDSLHFDDAADSYIPNPFTVRLTCVNNGNASAYDVTGTIVLPRYVEFDPPDQPATKQFYPLEMKKWNIGDPVPEVSWTVRWVPRLRYDAQPEFRCTVTGMNSDGIRLDSTELRGQTRVPGLMPYFDCTLEIPDSLELNAEETNVEPNPFLVRYTVTNRSKQVGKITRVYISFPSDGLTLSPVSGNPVNQALDLTLEKGESHTFEWIIDVANLIIRRNVLIQVTALDDEGNPIVCEDWLPIANLKTALFDSCLGSSAKVLRYVPSQNGYDPRQFVISAKLRNGGGANLNYVVGELEWTDASGLDLIEFDPMYPGDNTNPKVHSVLFPRQSVDFEWGFRLKNSNTTGVTQYMVFNLKFGSKETPYHSGCELVVEIEPTTLTAIHEQSLPSESLLYPNHPNPFYSSTTIRYTLQNQQYVTLAVFDLYGREIRTLVNSKFQTAGVHQVFFESAGLPPGMYFYRLTAGKQTRTRRMVLQ